MEIIDGHNIIKRSFDIINSIIAILILFPLFLLISILIKFDSNGPVIFKQIRVGKNERHFYIYKFRTMITDAENKGKKITIGQDSRITKMGQYLRKYKLDELPQVFNVLKGDMSIVGPRPEVPHYTKLYTCDQRRIFRIRPGISDYASIKYSNESEILYRSEDPEKTYIEEVMGDKLTLNLYYLENKSLWIDIKIISLTILKIIKVGKKYENTNA